MHPKDVGHSVPMDVYVHREHLSRNPLREEPPHPVIPHVRGYPPSLTPRADLWKHEPDITNHLRICHRPLQRRRSFSDVYTGKKWSHRDFEDQEDQTKPDIVALRTSARSEFQAHKDLEYLVVRRGD